MSYQRIIALSAFSLLMPFATQAAYWSPHVGVDYKYWDLKPNVYYVDVYPNLNNTVNLYAGTRINGFFGIDFGYEESENTHYTAVFVGDGTELYFAVPEGPGDSSMIDMRLKSIHIDLNFYWEVYPCFEVIFMAGVAFLNPETHINHISDGIWYQYRGGAEQKSMGRIGIGLQYNFLPCFGIRALLNWEPDRRINFIGFDENDNAFSIYPYDTSTMFNFGFVYSFSTPRRHRVVEFIDVYDADP